MIWLLLACGGGGEADLALDATARGDCAEVSFEELAVVCWTEEAVQAARQGEEAAAGAACQELSQPLWREECHFRAAEELGLAGHLGASARACAQAGRFAEFCLIHLAWWARPFPVEARPGSDAAWPAVQEQLARVQGLSEAHAAMLRAGVWFDLYYGSGSADPSEARRADSPEARTAWAHEAVRLGAGREAWQQGATGEPLSQACWRGRVADPVPAPSLGPTTPLVHGGERLVGRDLDEDLDIALLEARFFHGQVDPAALSAALLDPRDRVRWTAARLLARLRDPAAIQLLDSGDAGLVAAVQAGQRGEVITWAASEDCP